MLRDTAAVSLILFHYFSFIIFLFISPLFIFSSPRAEVIFMDFPTPADFGDLR